MPGVGGGGTAEVDLELRSAQLDGMCDGVGGEVFSEEENEGDVATNEEYQNVTDRAEDIDDVHNGVRLLATVGTDAEDDDNPADISNNLNSNLTTSVSTDSSSFDSSISNNNQMFSEVDFSKYKRL